MEFDKSRVYTAVNAEELKVGSKAICADYLQNLKENVELGINVYTITRIMDEHCISRFERSDDTRWNLAYLISEPEEKVLKWTDLKVGDVIRHKESGVEYMITGMDKRNKSGHCYFAEAWFSDSFLEEYEKVEDA